MPPASRLNPKGKPENVLRRKIGKIRKEILALKSKLEGASSSEAKTKIIEAIAALKKKMESLQAIRKNASKREEERKRELREKIKKVHKISGIDKIQEKEVQGGRCSGK